MNDAQTYTYVAETGAWGYSAIPGRSIQWRVVDGARIEIRCYWPSTAAFRERQNHE